MTSRLKELERIEKGEISITDVIIKGEIKLAKEKEARENAENLLKEVASNIDENGNVKLDQFTIKKLLEITS